MKLILIDGYGFVFRAFHSLPPLTSSIDGKQVGAVYGFINMLLKLIKNKKFDAIAVVLDSGKENFRHKLFAQYKANRPDAPAELIVQFPKIRDAAKAFGIAVIEEDGFEADDLIASYAILAKQKKYDVTIVSADKDLLQLLPHNIEIYDPLKDRFLDEEYVKTKFGISANYIIDFLSLVGDSSDNIPGVKGIGLKTASELINQFGGIHDIYNSLPKIENARRRKLLEDGKESAYLSYQLINLPLDLKLQYTIEDLLLEKIDEKLLFAYLNAQGFKKLAQRIEPKVDKEELVITLSSPKELKKYVQALGKTFNLALHYNTKYLFISTNGVNLKCILQIQSQGNLFENTNFTAFDYLSELSEILAEPGIKKIVFDLKKFLKLGVVINNVDDISIMQYSILTKRTENDLVKTFSQYFHSEEVNSAKPLLDIYKALQEQQIAQKICTLYHRVDRLMPMIVNQMEDNGILLDIEVLQSLGQEFEQILEQTKKIIYEKVGYEFNVASPKQLAEALFEHLKIPHKQKGAISTASEVLEELEHEGYDIASDIIEFRKYHKLLSTYVDALPKCIYQSTGRVHSTFNISATATGRFSSTNPNLQNIPIKSEEGMKVRQAFIAKPGYTLISADYSQIELRLLAHFAHIPSLQDAFFAGKDIHTATACDMFGVSEDRVDATLRRKAKTINFGIIYGISAFGLARRLDITKVQAQQFIDTYFAKYPGILEYMQDMIKLAQENGYVNSIMGRKCEIEDINSQIAARRNFAQRVAINAPLQSSSADIIKKAMCDMDAEIIRFLVLQVHDELLFEVPEPLIDQFSSQIKRTMENTYKLNVPLIVSVHHGKNWAKSV